jgi:sterol desaturase/sphingolipid hydroxylase (fatty acid hydroxylase superfamily)
MNPNSRLTGQDWFWIAFVTVIGAVATFGGLILFLPPYVIALLAGYLATLNFSEFFDRRDRAKFVLKVLAVVIPVFILLSLIEVALFPSIYHRFR